MSWMRDVDGNLVNLDHSPEIYVGENTDENAEETHVVVAESILPDRQSILFAGDEKACSDFRDKVATKLPMVRL